MTGSTETVTPAVPLSKREQDQQRREAAKGAKVLSSKEERRQQEQMENMLRQQAQQREQRAMMHEQRELRMREVMALEAIAEALHVANEDKILAWRTAQEAKAAEEQKRIEAEQAKARADTQAAAKDCTGHDETCAGGPGHVHVASEAPAPQAT